MIVVPDLPTEFQRPATSCEEWLWKQLQAAMASNGRMVNALQAAAHGDADTVSNALADAMADFKAADAWLANYGKGVAQKYEPVVEELQNLVCDGCGHRIGWTGEHDAAQTKLERTDWRKCNHCKHARAALAKLEGRDTL